MSSFLLTQVRSFAAQGASQRALLFGGGVDDTVKNLQIGATQFRAAFIERSSPIWRETGFTIDTDAVAILPDSLGLTYALDTVVTHIATSRTFNVVGIVRDEAGLQARVALMLPSATS